MKIYITHSNHFYRAISCRCNWSILRKLPKTQFLLKVSYKKVWRTTFTGVEFIRMSFKVQKHSEYAIWSRSDTPISIKGPLCFLKKYCKNFLSVEPGSGHKGKNFSNFWKHVFFSRIGPFRIVWRKNLFVDFVAGRHEIVPPEPSSCSNISKRTELVT